MKIAIAAAGQDLEARVDPRFGRCQGFVVVDTDTGEFSAITNPGAMAGGGAGIQAAQAVARSGADAVAAGNFGPKAHEALAAGGIRCYLVEGGTVREAAEALQAGRLPEATAASVPSHFGVGGGQRP